MEYENKDERRIMTREEEILIEKVIWLIEDSYPDTDDWGHDALVKGIKEYLNTRADELNQMFGDSEILTSNPWHKVADGDLPKHFGDYLVIIDSKQFGRRWAIKCWYGYPEDPFGDNISKEWVLEEDEIVSYWMEIPEIKED